MKEIVFAGSGGQGVLTCGLIFSDIAISKFPHVTWTPSYGSAMRGGTANCTVKYCEDFVYNPSQEEPDLLLAMNDPSLVKFLPIVAPGGTVVVSDAVAIPADARKDVTYVTVPCFDIAAKLNNPRAANIVMTGAITKVMGEFTGEEAVAAMNRMFEKKGKAKFAEANSAAFNAGFNAI
ncbi:MAG: 2-oxoacid:acceptor oxidoreductase family protein [Oscillospiraceae bacterium]